MDSKRLFADLESFEQTNISPLFGALYLSGAAWIVNPNNLPLHGIAFSRVPVGTVLDHRHHYFKTLQVRRSYIGCYDSKLEFIDGSTSVNMLSINIAGFSNFQPHVENAIKNINAQARILLCKAHSESIKYFSLKAGERQESHMNAEIYCAIASIIETSRDTHNIKSNKKDEGSQ